MALRQEHARAFDVPEALDDRRRLVPERYEAAAAVAGPTAATPGHAGWTSSPASRRRSPTAATPFTLVKTTQS